MRIPKPQNAHCFGCDKILPSILPKLQKFFVFPVRNTHTPKDSLTEKRAFYPNLANAQLTRAREEQQQNTELYGTCSQESGGESYLFSWENSSSKAGNTPFPFFKHEMSFIGEEFG